MRKEHDSQPQECGVAQTGFQQQEIGGSYSFDVAGSIVVTDDGLSPLAQSLQWQHGELHDAGQDGHSAHSDISSVMEQGGVEADGDDAFTGLHDESGRSQSHAWKDDGRLQPQIAKTNPKERLFPAQEQQNPCTGHGLGQYGGQSCSPDAHAQSEDEDRIQDDVGDGADQDREHTGPGEALGGDKGVHAQGQLNEDGTQGIDVHISHTIFDGVFAGAKSHQEIPVPDQQDGGKCDGYQNLQQKAISQSSFCRFHVVLSHENGCPGSAAAADQSGKCGDNHDQGHTDAYASQCHGAGVRNVTDIDPVNDIVEHVDDLGGDGWNCKPE